MIRQTKQVAIRMPDKMYKKISKLARKNDLWVSEWIRELIIKELNSPTR